MKKFESKLSRQSILKRLRDAIDPLSVSLAFVLIHPSEKRRLEPDQQALGNLLNDGEIYALKIAR